ncbi:MAG TPA: DegT/DnrJ/EryC1/StrS family aminotransferase [Candidatus Marinimicrobia bacterium]|jgi:dTDP-4-amino-4,6-dideoxygalactose transaminase|nr:DegT/DnrJ/EryC1/StrS family aminotransferase [Candidatus Neomarinimicrobiota bacterium]HQK11052.1 DegT/DnrJ/EryC1/StrS family aminotransferase [Candidatus Neomarinimicrobiota bacterium]
MKVPLLDLKAQLTTIRSEMLNAITAVLDSTQYIMGPPVADLEEKIADYCGVQFAVGVSSGTDALLVALMALDVKPGDLVITTPYSFFATAGVIARLGARPVFIDIDPRTFNLDPNQLHDWFIKNSRQIKKVKAIIPVHLYGQCADLDPILEIAGKYDIPVIEDAAQAIGASYPSKNGIKKAGSMGKMGCFSFFPTKNLGGIGDGGMVITNDSALAEKITKLRNHGSHQKYYHSLIGGNFRLDTIQAAALLVKLPHLESWHLARQKHAEYYDKAFNDSMIKAPYVAYQRSYHIYNQYVILVPDKRDELRQYLADNEIGTEVYYPVPFHLQECFKYLGYKNGDFPHSEYTAAHSLALPIYPELMEDMQAYVVEKVLKFY